MSELAELTAAQRALSLVETPEDAKALYDQLETLSQYAQRFRLDHEKQNEIAQTKLRTARKGGQLLAQTVRPGNPQLSRDAIIRTLPEGFTLSMSSRWQTLAKDLSDDEFDDFLSNTEEITLRAALTAAGRAKRDRDIRARRQVMMAKAQAYIEEIGEDACRLEVGDMVTWRPSELVDAIITDPPYVTDDSIALHWALGDFALDVLPEGGALVCLTWPPLLPAAMNALDREGLVYRWTAAWVFETTARTPLYERRVFDGWKPALVYHKGYMPDDATYLYDVVSSPDADKTHHEWGQSPEGFMQFVRAFTQPGELVCDPFLGGGTTAVAALGESRRFVGCDIDEDAIETTRARLAK